MSKQNYLRSQATTESPLALPEPDTFYWNLDAKGIFSMSTTYELAEGKMIDDANQIDYANDPPQTVPLPSSVGIKWHPPQVGWYKLNADGSAIMYPGRTLLDQFPHYQLKHKFREDNRCADALARLGSNFSNPS
ncbi:hypothetical protein J1N35_045458 [Gossypium stocksii]|uniref:RNase H type-1 domain-containing protein n=1 Tax=Gossypium stocksii TaxID=47602 RepID=A0A9D3UBA5_9ROSI|nr:hypothetical protein J1N35_045458 [Gossypium stocksii]